MKFNFYHYFGLIGLLLTINSIAAYEKDSSEISNVSAVDPKAIGQILILDQGRQKPLDSYARSILLQFSTKGKYRLNKKKSISATEWMAHVFFQPDQTKDYKVFRIINPQVLVAMGLDLKEERRYSYNQLSPGLRLLGEKANEIVKIEEKDRDAVQAELIRVYSNLTLYINLAATFQFAIPDPGFQIYDPSLILFLGFKKEENPPSYYQLFSKAGLIYAIMDSLQNKKSEEWTQSEREIVKVSKVMYEWSNFFKNIPIGLIPTKNHGDEFWFSPWDVLNNRDLLTTIRSEIQLLSEMCLSYLKEDQIKFDNSVTRYLLTQKERVGEQVVLKSSNMELMYNKWDLFYRSKVGYVLSGLLLLLSFIFWKKSLYITSITIGLVSFLSHTVGILMRMQIMSRPPVTNLFETFIFVGWICFLLGLISEWIQRKKVGFLTSTVSAFAMLMISGKYAREGDTMGMLVAVLDSNFWLSTHVIAITMGYAGACAAGVVGHVYIVQALLKVDKKVLKESYRTMYGILAFGLTLSFIGTVLGGIWADQSWGRFWGWDPKENGALLIVLWCAILIHCRLDGILQGFGIAVGTVLGIIVVMFAWFGVNLLGVGLHSYGFTSGVFNSLMIYIIAEILFLAVTGFWFYINQRLKKV